ncbi:MAG: hypothetical protein NTV69_09505, partial [Caldilinea sp.]|nr:hypothetical protein [Caldilinea sp.]
MDSSLHWVSVDGFCLVWAVAAAVGVFRSGPAYAAFMGFEKPQFGSSSAAWWQHSGCDILVERM